MNTTIISFLFLLSLLLSPFTSHSLTTNPNSRSKHRFSKIYAFGDSFTDTGNTHTTNLTGPSFAYVSNPPYGMTFFHHPTNRYSDGRLVVDFLASTLSLPFLPPYLSPNSNFSHGVNFAVAGSTAIEYEFFVKNNISIAYVPKSIVTQLGWFDKFVKERGEKDFEDALFWVGEIGANDYGYSSIKGNLSKDLIRTLVVKRVTNFLEGLLKRGAKHIAVQNLPLLGCLPLSLTMTPPTDRDALNCSSQLNKLYKTHNTLLLTKVNQLRKKYPLATISYADYYAAHYAVMKNRKKYGFTEPFKTCCGSGGGDLNFNFFSTCGSPSVNSSFPDPSKYVNWDGVHLTESIYRVISDLFFKDRYMSPPFRVLLGRA